MTPEEKTIADTLGEIKTAIAVIQDRQAEQSRVREVLGKWLMWLAGIGVSLGIGGTGGVVQNAIKNAEQDQRLNQLEHQGAKP